MLQAPILAFFRFCARIESVISGSRSIGAARFVVQMQSTPIDSA